MEIDFLGLNSSKYNLEQQSSKTPFIDTGGVEISLSLSTSSSLNFSEKKKWQLAAYNDTTPTSSSTICSFAPYNSQDNSHMKEQTGLLLVAPPLFRHSAAGFPYDLNDAATINLRNMPQLYAAPAPAPNVLSDQQKAENSVYNAGSASPGGYTPTVAMARRATLARFLEKRLHRMNQARNCNLKRR